jgi:hypothetical protein
MLFQNTISISVFTKNWSVVISLYMPKEKQYLLPMIYSIHVSSPPLTRHGQVLCYTNHQNAQTRWKKRSLGKRPATLGKQQGNRRVEMKSAEKRPRTILTHGGQPP